jgi:hypothetical protein
METVIAVILCPLYYTTFIAGFIYRPIKLGFTDGFLYWSTRCELLASKDLFPATEVEEPLEKEE